MLRPTQPYLPSPVRGVFYFLYLILDGWSRKIVGWDVHGVESADLASALVCTTCRAMGLDPKGLVLHADNGGPMKGSTMVTTLEKLGVLASYSRPRVSDDNPFSESLFRTMKYRPRISRWSLCGSGRGAGLGGGLRALVQHGAPAPRDPLRDTGGPAWRP